MALTITIKKPAPKGGDMIIHGVGQAPEMKAPTPKVEKVASAPQWTPVALKDIPGMPTVKLRVATRMYQPVDGSSTGSRYFVVAAGSSLRIAARYKPGTLSIRAEAPNLDADLQKALKIAGFKIGKDYASVHFSESDYVLLARTLGAVLMALSDRLDTPLPQFDIVRKAT